MLDDKFVSYFVEEREHPDFAWPICTIHSEQNDESFLGFGMKNLFGYHSLEILLTPTDKRYSNFSEFQRALICSYLSYLFAVCHSRNVIIGDVKPDNICVQPDGYHVAIIDCDSFQFSLNGIEYTTNVGTHEYASPRLIQISKSNPGVLNLDKVHREFSDDTFALAILCFRLLMDGYHPFQTTKANKYKAKVFDNIQNRIFPYSGGVIRPPKNAPTSKYESLPYEVQSLFEGAFKNAEYVSAARWRDVFYNYAKSLDEPKPVLTVIEQAQAAYPPALARRSQREGFWSRVRKFLVRP